MTSISTKALVLGASGFIGGHLVDNLQKQGYQTATFDIDEGCDILDFTALDQKVESVNPQVIFDCSGILGTAETFDHIHQTVDVNIKGTLNVLEVSRKHEIPMIYISLTNDWLNPYTITKKAATAFCMMYAREYGAKVAVLKALNVYGSRQLWKKVRKYIPTFITSALNDEDIIINGNGSQIVDAIHVADVCAMMIKMYEMETCWGKEIDGGTGSPLTINAVVDTILRLTNSKSTVVYKSRRIGEPENSVSLADSAPAKELLGYAAKISFEEGIKQVIDWYKDHLDYDV